MDIGLQQRDVEMEESSCEMESSLYFRKGGKLVEGVAQFKYQGRTLDQMDDEWSAVRRNIKRARRVCGRFGNMLQR